MLLGKAQQQAPGVASSMGQLRRQHQHAHTCGAAGPAAHAGTCLAAVEDALHLQVNPILLQQGWSLQQRRGGGRNSKVS